MIPQRWMPAVLIAAACSDYKIGNPDEDFLPRPTIELDPGTIDFGGVPRNTVQTATLRIGNSGNAGLRLEGIEIDGSTAFTVLDDVAGLDVAPGEWTQVELAFEPDQASHEATALVMSDDPAEPAAPVDLLGTGLFPQLDISPNPIDFGSVMLDCTGSRTVTFKNIGQVELTITEVAQIGSAFDVATLPDLPVTLFPGESTTADLTFSPPLEGDNAGELWVKSDEPAGQRKAEETGVGDTSALVEELFFQGDGPWDQIDMLFYVDQSGSMEDNQARLRGEAESFMASLSELDLDYQVAVATRDDGCINTGIITPDTENAETTFRNGITGMAGAFTEAGLTVTREGLENTGTGECNDGLLREGAKTALVLVSDEPEQSPDNWLDLVGEIQGIAPSVTISAIAGDYPGGCATAEPGRGYYEAAIATSGQFLSICSDSWGDYLSGITEASVAAPTDTFSLAEAPMPDTIEVLIDGEHDLHWDYDSVENAVVFREDHWPPERSRVDVSYDAWYECP